MTSPLKYGLIGCGQAGLVHAYHFSRDARIRPAACMDIDGARAERVRVELGFDRAFTDLRKMLEETDLDVVSIATPPSEHAAQIRAAADRGIQVLCEKPLLLHEEEIRPVLEACRSKGVRLSIMLPRRFYNNSLAAKTALAKGALGPIREVRFTLECRKKDDYYAGWRGRKKHVGGGVLMSQAIHSIDQLVFLFGKPVSVQGRVWTIRNGIDIEDEAEGTIRFEGGIEVCLKATTHSKEHLWRGLTVIRGERGRIVLDSAVTPEWDVPGLEPPTPEEEENVPIPYKPSYYGPGHLKVIRNFIGSLQGLEPSRTAAEECLDALKIIWAWYRSSEREGERAEAAFVDKPL